MASCFVKVIISNKVKPHWSFSSWPGLSRPSTSSLPHDRKDVDARHKAGHGE